MSSRTACFPCRPCRPGSTRGKELIAYLLDTMQQTSRCALGGGVPLPIKSAIQHFEAELKDCFKP